MGALQGLIPWTNGHLPLSHRASHGLEKGCSAELLASLWRRASPSASPKASLSSSALPKDSRSRWVQAALQERTGSGHKGRHCGKGGTLESLPGSPVCARQCPGAWF